jgi:hypothetical protein
MERARIPEISACVQSSGFFFTPELWIGEFCRQMLLRLNNTGLVTLDSAP